MGKNQLRKLASETLYGAYKTKMKKGNWNLVWRSGTIYSLNGEKKSNL